MRVIVRHIFGDLDPYFDFAECTGPHVEMELDVLPVVGAEFYLTPDERKDIVQQYLKEPDINEITTEWYSEIRPLGEIIHILVERFYIVSAIWFTYDKKGRFVLIDLIEE